MLKKHLTEYDFPNDLKEMQLEELELLSFEIRDYLIENVSKTGGHLASNLGVVELTIGLHKVFDSPKDKIIWDVGHQAYIHKILTGRAKELSSIRSFQGISGFPKRCESLHDCFETGHSSTSISAATGFAVARDLKGEDFNVVAIIGDGALTGGLSYEGLNNCGDLKSKLLVILNDNEMSIEKNTGGITKHLNKLRASSRYLDFKKQLKKTLKAIPAVGDGIYNGVEHLKDSIKYALVNGAVFEEFGFKYIGPIDGHNISEIIETLELTKEIEVPVLLHVITKKGKGYKKAEQSPNKFHGVSPFDPETGVLGNAKENSFSNVLGKKLTSLAKKDNKIVAVCAAMIEGTGLDTFKNTFPERLFDVGIAEAHAVTFSAGLAQSGLKPVVAIYSTFLQRAYDQILMDVCLQNLPVVFAIDRAGNVGQDGETHHGIFDISYLAHMPNLTILAPKDGDELEEMLEYALSLDSPCAIRYPRGSAASVTIDDDGIYPIQIWATGNMVKIANEASKILRKENIFSSVINVKKIKPFDEELLLNTASKANYIFTLEDNTIIGGFGQQVYQLIKNNCINKTKIYNFGWPDRFIEHGNVDQLFKEYQLDPMGISKRVRYIIEG